MRDKVATDGVHTAERTTTFEEKGERPKRYRTEVRVESFRLPARPNRLTIMGFNPAWDEGEGGGGSVPAWTVLSRKCRTAIRTETKLSVQALMINLYKSYKQQQKKKKKKKKTLNGTRPLPSCLSWKPLNLHQ